jgi:hypothetical protein
MHSTKLSANFRLLQQTSEMKTHKQATPLQGKKKKKGKFLVNSAFGFDVA